MDSYWVKSSPVPEYAPLDRPLEVDVLVVGAGIAGLTSAYLLKKAGLRVAVIDRQQIGGVDTLYTSAHVTFVTDLDLPELVDAVGLEHAQAVWDAGRAAQFQIDAIVRDEAIDCDWQWVPAYRYLAPRASRNRLDGFQREVELANDLGFAAEFVDAVPVVARPGVHFPRQARLHPARYVAHLAEIVNERGPFVFSSTNADEARLVDGSIEVSARGIPIRAGYLVVATHSPFSGTSSLLSATLLQTKLYLYTSYVVAGRLPPGSLPESLLWDTSDPYHYIRIDRHADHDYVILGGADHKTGQQEHTSKSYASLERTAKRLFPQLDLTDRWSGQVIETNDGLPYIGETSDRQFVATGFAGNGMTFGTLGAMMAADRILGRENPWQGLFDVGRTRVAAGVWNYIKENADYPYYLIRGRISSSTPSHTADRPPAGQVIVEDGKRIAVARVDGREHRLSAVCPHMGCVVAWNETEQTWDCPCHGSRFTAEGQVMSGPAATPLETIEPAASEPSIDEERATG